MVLLGYSPNMGGYSAVQAYIRAVRAYYRQEEGRWGGEGGERVKGSRRKTGQKESARKPR